MFKVAPLHSNLMLVSMAVFIISAFYLNDPLIKTWAWAFLIVSVLVFISTMISLGNIPVGYPEHLNKLAIHKKDHYKKKK